MTEVEQVLAAIAKNDQEIRDSRERMERIRRERIARDLRAGLRVLKCHCPECVQRALDIDGPEPDPRTCARARAMIADERARAAKEQ